MKEKGKDPVTIIIIYIIFVSLQTFLSLFLAVKRNVMKLGTDKVKMITAAAEELLEKWPSCNKTQVTEGLQSVNELWEQFERDLLEGIYKTWTLDHGHAAIRL